MEWTFYLFDRFKTPPSLSSSYLGFFDDELSSAMDENSIRFFGGIDRSLEKSTGEFDIDLRDDSVEVPE